MKRWPIVPCAAVFAAALLASPAVEARTKLAALPEREANLVRLDNPSATLVEEERVLTLQEGENLVDFSWRGVRVDPDSIRIALLSHPDKANLLSVSYPPNEAALTWRIHSNGAWEERVRISYLLADIDRLVTYKALATRDEKALDLDAFLVLRNFSGEDFEAATVSLDQGDPFAGKIAHEETRQLHFLSFKGVPIRKVFTWDSGKIPWEPKRLDRNVGIPVCYVIRNDKASSMGMSGLWEGKTRVFQDDGHGTTIFLGEDRVGKTPVGEEMKIYIGDSRDISVTQLKKRDLRINPRPSASRVVLYDTDEAITARLENFKDQAVTVDLVEHIPGEWDMEKTDLAYEKTDANTIVFHVMLPAKGKVELEFAYHRRNIRN
ncbi:MAG: hypothetical protein M0Z38_10130 [Deltaproteobacteria bacterium]|nr:hypothetical protein [Deltaproteobacteria bacterium]